MRRLLLVLAACSSKKADPSPAPAEYETGGYKDVVVRTQQPSGPSGPSGHEVRTSLACTATIPDPAPRADPPVQAPRSTTTFEQEMKAHEQRRAMLDTLPGDRLVLEAKADELVYAVLDRAQDGFGTLTAAERALQLYSMMDGEVRNGGFHQFFFNSTGDDAVAIRAAIVTIGPPELLPIYDCALTAFPGNNPSADHGERNDQLARWGDRQFDIFRKLDTAYYGLDSISAALDAYVRQHVAEFPSIQRPLKH